MAAHPPGRSGKTAGVPDAYQPYPHCKNFGRSPLPLRPALRTFAPELKTPPCHVPTARTLCPHGSRRTAAPRIPFHPPSGLEHRPRRIVGRGRAQRRRKKPAHGPADPARSLAQRDHKHISPRRDGRHPLPFLPRHPSPGRTEEHVLPATLERHRNGCLAPGGGGLSPTVPRGVLRTGRFRDRTPGRSARHLPLQRGIAQTARSPRLVRRPRARCWTGCCAPCAKKACCNAS